MAIYPIWQMFCCGAGLIIGPVNRLISAREETFEDLEDTPRPDPRSAVPPLPSGPSSVTDAQSAFQLPVGTVTFLLGDLEGSTRLWEQHPDAMTKAVARLYEVVDEEIVRLDGGRPIEQGEGDSVVAVFARASDALVCSVAIQRAIEEERWPEDIQMKFRIGIHTGEAQLRDEGNYFGQAVIRGARLRSTGHGGQILLSQVAHDLVIDSLPEDITVKDLGLKRLRDLSRPERVYQVCHPELSSEFPPLLSLDELPNNLPLQLTSFIGRDAEIVEIGRLLGSTRLFTLTGSGGCGKTRLALQVAAETIDAYPDGVWWVDLAPLTDPDLVPTAIAAALSVRDVPMQELSITIANQLREKQILIVIDNCEHLLSSCHALADTLLQLCPSLTLFATSREPLGLPGETTWRVPSLSLPEEKQPFTMEALTQCEAVRLFTDRAVKARPNFTVTNQNASYVAEICQRLDGIPLAIELAAARTRVLSAEQIAAGLADRFLLLTGGGRTALPRQRTLEASVDWSHNLLTEDERILLRRLSVFSGGFTLDAAEVICAGEGIEQFGILDLLTQLVDKSLVQMDEVEGAARYRLLETIRHSARQKLSDAGESGPVRSGHLEFYLSLAEEAEVQLAGHGVRQWAARLDLENDNLRALADWGLHSNQVDAVLKLCGSLFLFWVLRGHLSEGLRLTASTLDTHEGEPTSRARALTTAAGLAMHLVDAPAARGYGEEALILGRELEDKKIIGRALCWLGWAKIFWDPLACAPVFEEAITTSQDIEDSWYHAQSLIGYGFMNVQASRFGDARKHLEEARFVARKMGDYFNVRESLTWLGWTAAFSGRFDEAVTLTDEALAVIEDMHDEFFRAFVLVVVAQIKSQRGEYEDARRSFYEGIELARQTSNVGLLATAQGYLGTFEYQLGNLELSKSLTEEALIVLRELDIKWFISNALLSLQGVAELQGDSESSKKHLEEAKQMATESKIPFSLGRALLAEARLAKADGEYLSAETFQHQALALFMESDELPGMILALEALAGTAAEQSIGHEVARLLGAADSLRSTMRFVRFPMEVSEYGKNMSLARQACGDDEFETAYEEGSHLSVDAVVSYARRARGERKRPSSGWDSLTPTELEVVRLVATGLTNPKIGEQMFITSGTVKVHLSHIFSKLGIASRSELAAEAVRREI